MNIDIQHDQSNAIPPFNAELGRISVFIGANGTGKSKLLDAIMQECVSIVGAQKIFRLQPLGQLKDFGFEQAKVIARTEKQISNQVRSHANNRFGPNRFYIDENIILEALYALDQKEEREQLDALHKHQRAPKDYPAPLQRVSNFDLICEIFNAIVDVDLTFNRDTAHFSASSNRSNSQPYTIDKLSSGEQWIFRTLPALLHYKSAEMIVFVDEPETMLNEQLAVDFWTHIENIRGGPMCSTNSAAS